MSNISSLDKIVRLRRRRQAERVLRRGTSVVTGMGRAVWDGLSRISQGSREPRLNTNERRYRLGRLR